MNGYYNKIKVIKMNILFFGFEFGVRHEVDWLINNGSRGGFVCQVDRAC